MKIETANMTYVCETIGIGGWLPMSTLINPPPLVINGLHYVDFPHQMRKFMLNLASGEPLSLVQELPCFVNTIKMKLMLVTDFDLCVHDLISGCLFHIFMVELCRCQLFCYL
jgi:hypothetical protein